MNMREQFEKLPEIERLINEGNAVFHEKLNFYLCDHESLDIELSLDTAWYAYQEQQKRINELEALLYGEQK